MPPIWSYTTWTTSANWNCSLRQVPIGGALKLLTPSGRCCGLALVAQVEGLDGWLLVTQIWMIWLWLDYFAPWYLIRNTSIHNKRCHSEFTRTTVLFKKSFLQILLLLTFWHTFSRVPGTGIVKHQSGVELGEKSPCPGWTKNSWKYPAPSVRVNEQIAGAVNAVWWLETSCILRWGCTQTI